MNTYGPPPPFEVRGAETRGRQTEAGGRGVEDLLGWETRALETRCPPQAEILRFSKLSLLLIFDHVYQRQFRLNTPRVKENQTFLKSHPLIMKNESASRITNDLTYNFRTKRSDSIFHTFLKLGKSVEILNQSNGPCSIEHLTKTLT